MTTRVEQALQLGVDFATQLLQRSQALYPFATVLLPNGEHSMVSLDLGAAGTPAEAEAMLVRGLADDAADGVIAAAAWGYTVDVQGEEYSGPALKLFAEASGENPIVIYLPYSRADGQALQLGEPVRGPTMEPLVFTATGAPARASRVTKSTARPAVKRPATKRPATKRPATKRPAAKKPAAKKPTAKKPTAKKARRPPTVSRRR